jgi:hypothetical protein
VHFSNLYKTKRYDRFAAPTQEPLTEKVFPDLKEAANPELDCGFLIPAVLFEPVWQSPDAA